MEANDSYNLLIIARYPILKDQLKNILLEYSVFNNVHSCLNAQEARKILQYKTIDVMLIYNLSVRDFLFATDIGKRIKSLKIYGILANDYDEKSRASSFIGFNCYLLNYNPTITDVVEYITNTINRKLA